MLDVKDIEILRNVIGEVVDARIEKIDAKLEKIENRLGNIENELEVVKNRLENVENELEVVKNRLENVENELEVVKNRLKKIETDISNIQSTIENELRPNITIIAEGHWMLNRKLDEVFKMRDEHELILIRINRLENELITSK